MRGVLDWSLLCLVGATCVSGCGDSSAPPMGAPKDSAVPIDAVTDDAAPSDAPEAATPSDAPDAAPPDEGVFPDETGPACVGATAQPCGVCGAQQRSCDDAGTWSAFGACGEEKECTPGTVEACATGGQRRCTTACGWTACAAPGQGSVAAAGLVTLDGLTRSAQAIAHDGAGNLILAGTFDGAADFATSAGETDAFVAKFDATGKRLWAKRFGGIGYEFTSGVAADAAGNIVVVGTTQRTADLGAGPTTGGYDGDGFVIGLGPDGAVRWAHRFGDAQEQGPKAVAMDAKGNAFVVGWLEGTMTYGAVTLTSVGKKDAFVLSLATDGSPRFGRRVGGIGDQEAWAVATDARGRFAITGTVENGVDFGGGKRTGHSARDAFVAVYDGEGAHQWDVVFGEANQGETGTGITFDRFGDVVGVGIVPGAVDFGAGDVPNTGGLYIAAWGADGGSLWSRRFGHYWTQTVNGVAADRFGNVSAFGQFRGDIDFGDPQSPHSVGSDFKSDVGFVVGFRPGGAPDWSKLLAAGTPSGVSAGVYDDPGRLWVIGAGPGRIWADGAYQTAGPGAYLLALRP